MINLIQKTVFQKKHLTVKIHLCQIIAMPHDDFFEATLIEFTQWLRGAEKTIAKFERFENLPSGLIDHFKRNSDSVISLNKQLWRVLEINKDLRAHGNGVHIKVRLEPVQ